MYTISYNQQFSELGLSAFINYYHQTYWFPDTPGWIWSAIFLAIIFLLNLGDW
ncbi:hypothetical protein H3292_23415 [Providencia stuartii]|nr:hypothetical protein [Providencia stuartii]